MCGDLIGFGDNRFLNVTARRVKDRDQARVCPPAFDIPILTGVPSIRFMKRFLAITLLSALALAAKAQDAPASTTPSPAPDRPTRTLNAAPSGKPKQEIEVAAPRGPKESEVSTNALPKFPKRPSVSHGGLVSDVRKSTNRWKMFSLRRPANLKEDEANMIRDLRTEGGGAVKLFSVDF